MEFEHFPVENVRLTMKPMFHVLQWPRKARLWNERPERDLLDLTLCTIYQHFHASRFCTKNASLTQVRGCPARLMPDLKRRGND